MELKLANVKNLLPRRYADFVEAPSVIIRRNNPASNTPPSEWIDGMPLGNGDLGAMVYGPLESLTYCLCKADLWDLRYNENRSGLTFEKLKKLLEAGDKEKYEKYRLYYLSQHSRNWPSPQPAGLLRLHLCEGANLRSFSQTLDLYAAQCTHVCTPVGDTLLGNNLADIRARDIPGQYKIVSYVHAEANVLVIQILPKPGLRDSVGPFRITLSRQLNPQLPSPRFAKRGPVGLMSLQLPESCKYTLACQVLGAELVWDIAAGMLVGLCEKIPAGPITVLTTVATTNEAKDTAAGAIRVLKKFARKPLKSAAVGHHRWWRRLWDRSLIQLNNPVVEKPYYLGVYILASMSRPGKQLSGLQGVWLNQNAPPWNGDYHGDINVQCPFWQCFTGNRLDLVEPYYRHYLETLPQQRRDTWNFYRLPGVKPHMQGEPRGREIGGYITTTLWPAAGAWLCEHYINHYKYTGDKKFLRDVAWPVISEAARFLLAYLTEEGDGRLHVKPTNMPELWHDRIEAWGSDCPLDLTVIRELFAAAVEAANILRTERDFAKQLEASLARLAPYPTDPKNGIITLREKDYGRPYLYNCFMIYPGNALEISADGRLARLIRRTYERTLSDVTFWNSSCWGIVRAVQSARLGRAKEAWRTLHNWGTGGGGIGTWINNLNGFINWNSRTVMQVDGPTSYPAAVNETLVQGHDGIINLFPAVPRHFTGAFHSLRTVGGFLVSAAMKDGKVANLVVKSILGGICRIAGSFPNVQIRIHQLAPRRANIPARMDPAHKGFYFDTRRGHIYEVVLKDSVRPRSRS